jgi:hypothetical protein
MTSIAVRPGWAAATFTMLLVAACADLPGPASDAAGVSADEAGGAAWTEGTGWRVEEAWSIGGAAASEHEVFSHGALGLGLGANGQILVTDPVGRSVRVYDGAGGYVRSIGRVGEGPGEWRSPRGVGAGPEDRIWVADVLRYTVYDSVGAYIRYFRRPRLGMAFRQTHPLVFDAEGYLLDEIAVDSVSGPRELSIKLSLTRVGADGNASAAIPPIAMPPVPSFGPAPGVERPRGPGPNWTARFFPKLIYAVTPTGIWFAHSDRLRLVHRTFDGDTLHVAEPSHRDDLRVPDDVARALQQELREKGVRRDEVFARPVVQSLHVLDDGHVLAQIEETLGANGATLDVFSPDGRFLGSLDLGFPLDAASPMVSRGDTLFAVGLDEIDAKFLRRMVLRRGGG